MEVQENAFAPEDTTIHSVSLSDDAARRLQDVRAKVVGALRSPETNLEHAVNDIRQTVAHEAHRAEEVVDHAEAKAKHALAPTHGDQESELQSPLSPQTPQRTAAGGDEEEGQWESDAEGDGDSVSEETANTTAGPSSGTGTAIRQKSRSPKIKVPKIAMIRPPHGGVGGGRRRMSIRRGMLGARIAHPLHPKDKGDGHGERGDQHRDMQTVDGIPLPAGMSRESSGSEQERGRRPRPSHSDSRASSIRLMHRRVDSLRSIDTRREASPTRSIRWADEHEGGNSSAGTRRSGGLGSPGILSPVTPTGSLPGSAPPSDDEGEGEGHTPTHTVRFDMPSPLPTRDRR